MGITAKNDNLLKRWEDRAKRNGCDEIAYDGLHCKGETVYSDEGYWSRKPGDEERRWNESKWRILFITKDLNDDEAWDIRQETGRKNGSREVKVTSLFCKNMMRIVYGLTYVLDNGSVMPYSEANVMEDYVRSFDEGATARINCKKQPGGSQLGDKDLKAYIEEYRDLLKEQILLLDANVIVCCGGRNSIKDFVADNCYTDLQKLNDWVYYSRSESKIVIDSYHLSYLRLTYEEMMANVMEGLKRI